MSETPKADDPVPFKAVTFRNPWTALGQSVIIILIAIAASVGTHIVLTVNALTSLSMQNAVVNERLSLMQQSSRVETVQNVLVTAYSPTKRETDDTPYITASNKPVSEGSIAVSRDLFMDGWVFGKSVFIQCGSLSEARRGHCGIFIITDVMNRRWEKRLDIFIHDTKKAKKFGKKERLAVLLSLASAERL